MNEHYLKDVARSIHRYLVFTSYSGQTPLTLEYIEKELHEDSRCIHGIHLNDDLQMTRDSYFPEKFKGWSDRHKAEKKRGKKRS